jgi:hypothetical protein
MANKPASRNWNDIQIVIATASMALTLVFWNLFAGPDRETAVKRAQEQAAVLPPPQPSQITAPPAVQVQVQPTMQSTTLQGNGPILLGGSAPQTEIIVRVGGGGGGNSNNSGGGSPATSTKSS